MYINKKLHICIIAVLIGIILITCSELVFIFSNVLKPGGSGYVAVSTIVLSVLSLVAVGLICFLVRKKPENSIEEIHTLLKRFNGKDGFADNEDGEIIVTFEEVMHELHGLLQSIQIKLHGIDHNVEALTEGIRQVAADQNNLFSISAEIEAVRAKRDGFSVITGEVLSLLKQTSQLTASIRNMSNQLRTDVTEVVAELEHVVRRVAPNQIDVPMDAAMPNVPSTGIEPVSGA